MVPSDETHTLPEESSRTPPADGNGMTLALSIAWCADAPQRVGEIAFLASAPRILGRGDASPADPAPRLAFVRERGGDLEPSTALELPQLSRVQLRANSIADGTAHVENLGRLRLVHRGAEVSRATVREGDLLELGSQMLLVVVRRPFERAARRKLPFAFGDADAHGIVGESSAAWALRDAITFVGPRDGHVLIHGESGTGKELVARALHQESKRASGPLVSRNAATLPEALIDSELFGHARNFPNAGMPERQGLVGEADGGTLFLDEIAELPLAMQAHLLRVLDAGEYQRLGDSRPRRSSFRLVGATNRPLSAMKADVLARLIQRVEVPSLRARREDVPLLVRHILRRIADTDPAAGARWIDAAREPRVSIGFVRAAVERAYATNVRELEGVVWRALASSRGERLEPAPEDTSGSGASRETDAPDAAEETPSVARIQASLDENNGVLESTWRALGLSSRHALARLVKKHGLEIRRRSR
jgi:two-component system nitrogen regulation response regulator GlnG/two-component system response regulator HydG